MTIRAATALLALGTALPAWAEPVAQGPRNADFTPAFEGQTRAPASDSGVALAQEVLAEGLEHPWGIAALPGGGYLVTERAGRLRVIDESGLREAPVSGLPEVMSRKQGGLLDVALGPEFDSDRRIFFTYSKPMDGGKSATAAASAVLSEDMASVSDVQEIFVQDPPSPSPMHYGSRIVFDGAGHAFVTTGEHFTQDERQLAQDLDNTYGKVVRVGLDGATPGDNPFVGQDGATETIWSYGHRNVQGAAWRDGTLWTLEHGPKGGDELNRAEPGSNFGWPEVSYGIQYSGQPVGSGKAQGEDFVEPVYYWDPVIAPGGFLFYDGAMFGDWDGDIVAGSLSPGGLVRLELGEDGRVSGEERIGEDLGRVRDVEQAGDGALLVLIDEADGSVIRLTPEG